ncbi:hypothetical protein GBAR_LOCUS20821 [Geodia barretti]|uniref:Uncharacterized protein n=1 Tax=Geodia barretti TaxID=519541 RepID=A0AA35WY73_GEOBA|nr:hypothetical protein GBAR_LOCUS20821 [Geodia barretti]
MMIVRCLHLPPLLYHSSHQLQCVSDCHQLLWSLQSACHHHCLH